MEVRITGLRFARDRRLVLDVPSLTFAAGRTTALLGPNGSGKTTLLRLIGALERPAEGRVLVGGREAQADRGTRLSVAFAFQEAVFLRATVRSNLETGLRLRGFDGRERGRRIAEASRECGIEHLLGRPAQRLSRGEAQRANLARALCLRAPLTLLDEPMAGLDGSARARLLEDLPGMLRTFASTTILVTHDRTEAFRLADDVVLLIGGRVRAAGPKGEVFRAPPDAEAAEVLGYTVLRLEGGSAAIPPGGLAVAGGAGSAGERFSLEVEQVVDMGSHLEAVGRIAGQAVAIPLPEGAAPVPGAQLGVVAERVVRFGA
jgi:ABC-type sugar transport system ATPase subunit